MYMYVRVYMYSTCIMIFTDFSRLACTALFNCYVHVHVRMYTCTCTCMYVCIHVHVCMYTCTCLLFPHLTTCTVV